MDKSMHIIVDSIYIAGNENPSRESHNPHLILKDADGQPIYIGEQDWRAGCKLYFGKALDKPC
jgi:hypothetical protein